MTKKLLLIDLENKHKLDLSPLDESFRAISSAYKTFPLNVCC